MLESMLESRPRTAFPGPRVCAPYTRVLFHYALLHCVYLVQRLVFFAYTARFILLNSHMTPHFRSTKKPVSSLCVPVVGAVFVRDGNFVVCHECVKVGW
jgi:hypothetical protein